MLYEITPLETIQYHACNPITMDVVVQIKLFQNDNSSCIVREALLISQLSGGGASKFIGWIMKSLCRSTFGIAKLTTALCSSDK